jgi:hypothetical protein
VHLDLLPVTLAHAWAFGLHATAVERESEGDTTSSLWMLLTAEADFSRGETFLREGGVVHRVRLAGPPRVRWTDERSSVLPLVAAFGVSHRDIVEEPAEVPAPVAAPAGP